MGITEELAGRWDEVFALYRIPITRANRHAKEPCPLCGKRNKFRLFKDWLETGSYICVCGSGNGFSLLMNKTGMSFPEIVKKLCEKLSITLGEQTIKTEKNNYLKRLDALKKFNNMQELRGSPAEKYLFSRKITTLPQMAVKYTPSHFFLKEVNHEAMFSIATTDSGDIVYEHCTFLINGAKIEHTDSKKMFKKNGVFENNVAVRMFNHNGTLGLSEGIETGLSSTQMYGIPTWALMNSTFMKKMMAPKDVKKLVIFADNDSNGTGLEAAFTCGRKNILMPNSVEIVDIVWPRERGDFNDILEGKISPETCCWTLDKN